jgi:hypothetical protein
LKYIICIEKPSKICLTYGRLPAIIIRSVIEQIKHLVFIQDMPAMVRR